MIDIAALAKILSVFALALVSPGPDFMIVSSLSLKRSRADGIKAAAGIGAVIALYTLVSLTGLSALFARYFWMVAAIKLLGGIYLVYLAYALWRGSFKSPEATADADVTATLKRKNAFVAGMLCSLTNPKAIAFFASIFAIALTPDTTMATRATIGVLVPLSAFSWFSFVAYGLSKPGVRTRYQRWQKVIDRTAGTVMGLFGLRLIETARN
jgi:threonine efflux protein